LLDLKLNAWAQLKTSGQPPTPRFGHTLSFVSIIIFLKFSKKLDDQLIIFGGWSCNSGRRFNAITSNSENEYYEETDYFYSFNTGTLTWQKTKFSGDLPSSKLFNLQNLDRYGHSATVIRQNIIYFGGWEFGKALNDINILLSK
jgi:Rab9 effector protein with kelch motifs